MAEGLPEGLVASNTEVVSEGIESHDRVSDEDLARLWAAYSTNRSLLVNDIGRRLENFFWRVWGSRRIRERLRGSQIAFLFALISEGEIIRTTPMPSPRTSRMMARTSSDQQLQQPPTSIDSSSRIVEDSEVGRTSRSKRSESSISGESPTSEDDRRERRSSSRPPPILKRPGIESGSKKTAKILTPSWKTGPSDPDHDEAGAPPAKSFAERTSLSSVEPQQTQAHVKSDSLSSDAQESRSTSTSKGKKKAAFVVGGSWAKRRPALSRRKSSQSSSGGNSKVPSPKIGSGSPTASGSRRGSQFDTPSYQRPAGSKRPTSRSVSPISSSPFKLRSRSQLPDIAADTSSSHPQRLVDRDFRSSFVDRLRTQGLGSIKSPAATCLSTSFQARGSSFGTQDEGKGKEKATEEEDLAGLSLERLPSQVLEEEDEPAEPAALPRVRSQLTMLLKDDQRKGEKRGETSSKGKGKRGQKGA